MPTKLIQETEEAEVEVTEVDEVQTDPFTNEEGEPTLEARAISDFLSHADFGPVFEHPEAIEQTLTVGHAEPVTDFALELAEQNAEMEHAGSGMLHVDEKKKIPAAFLKHIKGKNGKKNGDDDSDDDDNGNGKNGNGKDENVSSTMSGSQKICTDGGKQAHKGEGPIGKDPKTGKTYPAAGNKAAGKTESEGDDTVDEKKKNGKKKMKGMDYEESTLYPELAATLDEMGMAMHHGAKHKGMKKGTMKMPEMQESEDVDERGSGDIYSNSGVQKGASAKPLVGNDDKGKGHRPMQSGANEAFVQFLDGEVALQLIDEDDLIQMFAHFCDELVEHVDESDEPLTAKAQLALLAEMFGIEEKGPFKKGEFKKMARKKVGKAQVGRMLGAMMNKGVIKRVAADTGYKGGDYAKDSGYKTGGKKSKQAKVAKFKKTNKAKLKASARKAKRKVKEGDEAVFLTIDEVPVFGIAVPIGEAQYEVGANADAKLTLEPAPEKTDEETSSQADDDTGTVPKKVAEAAAPVRVVNHAGSGRSGPQLVVEAARAGKRAHPIKSQGETAEEQGDDTLTESEQPKKTVKRSLGATLAAGMVKSTRR